MSEEPLEVTEDLTPSADTESVTTEQEATPEPVNDDTATSTEDAPEEKKHSRAEQRIQQLVGDKNAAMEYGNFWKEKFEQSNVPVAETPKPLVKPKLEDFDHDMDKFMAANDTYYAQIIDEKVNMGLSEGFKNFQKQETRKTLSAKWEKNKASFAADNPDYDQVAFATESMMEHLESQDDGPEIAYWLGQNPTEAQRIGMLPPSKQGFELGKLQMSSQKPAAKQKTTQAPEPPNPVGGQQPNTSVHNESIDDFMKRRRSEVKAKRA